MAGRLTLSWVNKDQALVPDEDGGYAWVERDDPRMTEVRLLQQAGHAGEIDDTGEDNLLIQGDSYDALHALSRTPEYAKQYRGKIKLVYIDPPFNTGQAFAHYDDALEHSVWLGMMRERLLLIRELLAPNGSVWVHLDDAEMAYCRVLMDEVFGRGNFIATVVWQKVYSPKNSARHLSVDQDYLLVYARNAEIWRPNDLGRSDAMNAAYRNPDNDPRGPWKPGDLVANKPYSLGRYGFETPGGRTIDGPPPGRYWRVSLEKLQELDRDGRIWWGEDGNNIPAVKRFLSEVRGRVPQTLWLYEEVGHNQTGKNEIQELFKGAEPFATPKPERLVQRVIEIGSNPGDIVLDSFLGSGTTAAVAHKMRRKWVGVELSCETIEKFARPRLEHVVAGEDPGGVTKDVEWAGGGSFRKLEVGPSLYKRAQRRLLLADWAKGDEFAQAVAAQLGFVYEPEAPFVGMKGRTRLAVVDGIVDDVVLTSIVAYLDDDERVTIVAKGAAPGAEQVLRELSSGSRLLKAPRDLVRRGRVVR